MPGHPHIRAARVADAHLLSELAMRSKAHWGYPPEFIEACRAELSYSEQQIDAPDWRFFVLEYEQQIVGFHALKILSARDIELDALFVEPAFIGMGHGRTLIGHAKATARAMDAARLIIQGDPHAARFYVAAGGVQTGTRESASVPGRLLPVFTIDLHRK